MLKKIRLILADFIAPNDFDSRILLTSRSAELVLHHSKGKPVQWETTTGLAVAAVYNYPSAEGPPKQPELQCNICTNLFSLEPRDPFQCPSCGSRDLTSTGNRV